MIQTGMLIFMHVEEADMVGRLKACGVGVVVGEEATATLDLAECGFPNAQVNIENGGSAAGTTRSDHHRLLWHSGSQRDCRVARELHVTPLTSAPTRADTCRCHCTTAWPHILWAPQVSSRADARFEPGCTWSWMSRSTAARTDRSSRGLRNSLKQEKRTQMVMGSKIAVCMPEVCITQGGCGSGSCSHPDQACTTWKRLAVYGTARA